MAHPVRDPDEAARRMKLRSNLAVWYVMTKQERSIANLPITNQDWADVHGVARRTIQDWIASDEFKADISRLRKERLVVQGTPDTLEPPPPSRVTADMSNTEIFGEVVRAQLQAASMGDKTALDFIKAANISKPFVEALTAEFSSEFPDSTDEELAAVFVDAFPELCADALRAKGWVVSL